MSHDHAYLALCIGELRATIKRLEERIVGLEDAFDNHVADQNPDYDRTDNVIELFPKEPDPPAA